MKIEMEKGERKRSASFKRQKTKKARKEGKSLEECEKEMRQIFQGSQKKERKIHEEKNNKNSTFQGQKVHQTLEEKLQEAQDTYTKMVKANRLVREGDHFGLIYLFGENMANTLLIPDCMGRTGFADYELHEAKAKIETLKCKIENIQDHYVLDANEYHIHGTLIRENYEAGRLQIFFNGPPPKETHMNLLSEGFKWARSQGAWQRPLNQKSRQAAEKILKWNQGLS